MAGCSFVINHNLCIKRTDDGTYRYFEIITKTAFKSSFAFGELASSVQEDLGGHLNILLY